MYNRHVITVYISWAVNLDAHHLQLKSDFYEGFYTLLHGSKFSSEDSALDSGLLLGVPVDHDHVHENYDSRPGATVTLLPCVVRVNKHAQGNLLAKWLRSIQGFFLLNIPIESSQFSLYLNSDISFPWLLGSSTNLEL